MTSTPTNADLEAWDVLTTALEGGYAEEFQVVDFDRDPERGYVITRAVLVTENPETTPDGEECDRFVVDAPTVRRGFHRFTKWVRENDPAHRSYLGQQWAIAHEDEDASWADLDAIGADAVLQFACFGKVVFG